MNQLEKFNQIQTFMFDLDGVLTNNRMLVMDSGDLLRQINVRDGYAIEAAIQRGYLVCIISGGTSKGIFQILTELGIKDIIPGGKNKVDAYNDLVNNYRLNEEEILYMGDDLPDYEVMRKVGFPCCPSDAVPEIRELSHYISHKAGGEGCVRDVIEKVMKLQGRW